MNARGDETRSRGVRLGDALERRWSALAIALVAAVLAGYRTLWPTEGAFLSSIDHGQKVMEDFSSQYYPMACAINSDPTPVLGYYYTAIFALALSPLCELDVSQARNAWGLLQLISVVLLTLGSTQFARLGRLGGLGLLAIVLTSFPVLHNLYWGQVSVALTALILCALVARDRGRSLSAGVLLGIAIAVKFYPALFLLYFAIRRDLRACMATAATFFVLYAVVPAIMLGPRSWLVFEALVRQSLHQAGWVTKDLNSQFAPHVLGRLYRLLLHAAPDAGLLRGATVGSAVVGLGCVLAAWRLSRHSAHRDSGLAAVPLFLALPFLLQTSWPHYFAFHPACQAVLLRVEWSRRGEGTSGALRLGLVGSSVVLSSTVAFTQFSSWELYSAWGLLFLSNVALLVVVGVEAVQRPRGSTSQSNPEAGKAATS